MKGKKVEWSGKRKTGRADGAGGAGGAGGATKDNHKGSWAI